MDLLAPWHLIIVALIAVLLFYRGDKLPDMARSFGRSLRVFKTEIKGLAEDDKARDSARDAAHDENGGQVNTTKAIAAPIVESAPRVVAAPSEPIPVQAEVLRPASGEQAARPRPRPAGSASRP